MCKAGSEEEEPLSPCRQGQSLSDYYSLHHNAKLRQNDQ